MVGIAGQHSPFLFALSERVLVRYAKAMCIVSFGVGSSKKKPYLGKTQLSLSVACKRRTDEADTGMARSQRLFHNSQWIIIPSCPLRMQWQKV